MMVFGKLVSVVMEHVDAVGADDRHVAEAGRMIESIKNAVEKLRMSNHRIDPGRKECTALIDIVSPFTKLPMEKIYTIAKSLYLKSHEAYDLIKKFATTSREAAELPQKKAREQAELEKARLEEEAAAKAALEAEERLKNPKVSRWKRAPEG